MICFNGNNLINVSPGWNGLSGHRSEEFWWGWPPRIQRGWTGSSLVVSRTTTCHMGSDLANKLWNPDLP